MHANGHVGFFNPDKNTDCMVLSPSVRRIAQRVRAWAQSDAQNASRLSHLEVRGEDLDGKAGLYMVLNEPTQRLEMEPLKRALADDVLMAVAGEGDVPYQRFGLDDDLYAYVPLDGFMHHPAIFWWVPLTDGTLDGAALAGGARRAGERPLRGCGGEAPRPPGSSTRTARPGSWNRRPSRRPALYQLL